MSRLICGACAFMLCMFGPALWGQSNPQIQTSHSSQPRALHKAWWTQAVIYEIYPRSFQDTNGDGVGDLKGVIQRLNYLQGLGVDAIWLTPFYPSPNADFGYDVSDYTNVAPEYGSMGDWDALVREADKRGIRILVDLVLNHSSDQHPWFKESRASLNSPKRDWYVWKNGGFGNEPPTHWSSIFGGYTWTFDPGTNQWYYHIFLPQQPDLNWASTSLRKAMFGVARFWLRHGAAGFRLDATPYLFEDASFPDDPDPKSGPPPVWLKPYNSDRPENHQVLRELRAILNGFPGDRVLLGESTTADIQSLAAVYGKNHDEINLPMDFLFGNLKKLDASAFKKQIDDAQLQLRGQTPVFFLSSHDHPRQWSTFGDGLNNDQIAKMTAALTLTQPGVVLMYYGEEIGMGDMEMSELQAVPLGPHRPRADDRDPARTPMQWNAEKGAGFTQGAPWLPIQSRASQYNVVDEKANPASIYNWYARLLKLRHVNPVFRDGAYVPLESGNPNVFAFARTTKDGRGALIVLSTSNQQEQVSIAGWPANVPLFRDVIVSSPSVSAPTTPSFGLAPYGVLITALQFNP
jgi:alpha-glucosidase